jgi:fatty acid desaturase
VKASVSNGVVVGPVTEIQDTFNGQEAKRLARKGVDMIAFLVWFLVVIAVLAIVIIGIKWLMGLAGIPIPAPLLAILGIILFIILVLAVFHFVPYTDVPRRY